MPDMFKLNDLIDTSTLPLNVMTLRDNNFINFVTQEAGDAAAALFEIQGINCVKSLLMTTDPFSIMNIRSLSLEQFKKQYGYLQDDNTYVIQPGVKGNVNYLVDLLKQKILEDAKLSKNSKRSQQLSSANKTTDTSLTTPNIASSISSNTSSTTPNITSSISSSISSTTIISKCLNPPTLGEQKAYIVETVNTWCEKNKSQFHLAQFSLIEGQHYFITIQGDSNDTLKGYIKCSCQKFLSLPLRRNKFQMSNFYRHLQDQRSGNMCRMMKEIISNTQSISTLSTNNQGTVTPSSNTSRDAPSSDIVPVTSSSVIISSNTSSPTTHPMLLPIHDDDINITESSVTTRKQPKRKADAIQRSYDTRESTKKKRG